MITDKTARKQEQRKSHKNLGRVYFEYTEYKETK